jgi:large subunit ribosomal protein L4
MTNARQGTASTKPALRLEGGRKPWRQKEQVAPVLARFVHRCGVVAVSSLVQSRDYQINMNRKERRLALRTALFSRSEDMIVVEDFTSELTRPKTKELMSAIARWGVEPDKKVLLILPERSENIYLSARNVAKLKLIAATQLNVYDLLNADKIVTTSSALEKNSGGLQ